MIKKPLMIIAILANANVALAAAPYIGGTIGANTTTISADDYSGVSHEASGTKPNLTAFGGYGGLVNKAFYLGGEVFANIAPGSFDVYNSDYINLKFSTRYTVGVSFIPGVMVSDHTMIYGRVGLVRGVFNLKEESPSPYSYYDMINDTEATTGTQVGAGLQTALSQHWDLRAEYIYTSYQAITWGGTDVTPKSNQFNVGFVYKFA